MGGDCFLEIHGWAYLGGDTWVGIHRWSFIGGHTWVGRIEPVFIFMLQEVSYPTATPQPARFSIRLQALHMLFFCFGAY